MSPIEQGVEIRIGLAATSVRRDGGTVTVTLGDGSTATGNELFAAVARTLHWSGLGLKCVGIEPACFIEVDAHARVPGHDWLYVIGDLNGPAPPTHTAKYQAAIAADHVLGKDMATGDGSSRLHTRPHITRPLSARPTRPRLRGHRRRAPCPPCAISESATKKAVVSCFALTTRQELPGSSRPQFEAAHLGCSQRAEQAASIKSSDLNARGCQCGSGPARHGSVSTPIDDGYHRPAAVAARRVLLSCLISGC
jgi:hypothetical protein